MGKRTLPIRPLALAHPLLVATLKAWDEVVCDESAKYPVFKCVYDSQCEHAAKVVPAKRHMFPPYSFAARYCFPESKPGAQAAKN